MSQEPLENKTIPDQTQTLDEEVWNAVAAFEQILEAMPEDRASLEALAHAYGEIGDHTRAKDYLLRLGQVLLDGHETAEAIRLMDRLVPYTKDDPRIGELIQGIQKLKGSQAPEPRGAASDFQVDLPCEDRLLTTEFNMADELSLAWHLLELGELTQEEYAELVDDLTEMSAKESIGTKSVLHVLEFRQSRNFEKIMRVLSQECGAPIINPENFDLQPEAAAALPLEYMVQRGAAVYEFIGLEALVVVMNPVALQLQHEVQTALGTTCHFFMTKPSDFDQMLTKASDVLENQNSEPDPAKQD